MTANAVRPRTRRPRLSRQEQQVLAEVSSLCEAIAASDGLLPTGKLLDPGSLRFLVELLRILEATP